jgi:predicted DNA-binding protein YlxM (UPF0122 family)
MSNEMKNMKANRKMNKKIIALTLGLGLAVGSLTGSYTIAQANERPAGIENMQTSQMGHAKLIFEKADHKDLLKLLQIDEETFKKDADSGMSLTEIAASYHVTRKPVVDVVVKNINRQIDKGLADQRITEEQAKELKANSQKKAQVIVDIKPIVFDNAGQTPQGMSDKQVPQGMNDKQVPQGMNDKQEPQGMSDKQVPQGMNDKQVPQGVNDKQVPQGVNDKQVPQGVNDKQVPQGVNDKQAPQGVNDKQNSNDNNQNLQDMLTLLKIDAQTFKQEQASGKSLAEIAATHNVPRQAVVDLVTKDMNQQIDTGLAEKRITPEQANEMKTNGTQKIQDMVDKSMVEQSTQPAAPQK